MSFIISVRANNCLQCSSYIDCLHLSTLLHLRSIKLVLRGVQSVDYFPAFPVTTWCRLQRLIGGLDRKCGGISAAWPLLYRACTRLIPRKFLIILNENKVGVGLLPLLAGHYISFGFCSFSVWTTATKELRRYAAKIFQAHEVPRKSNLGTRSSGELWPLKEVQR